MATLTRFERLQYSYLDWYLNAQTTLIAEYKMAAALDAGDGATIRRHFTTDRVLVKTSGTKDGTVKLKYNQGCSFDKEWQLAARGTTFIDGKWLFSVNKFFNSHELPTMLGCDLPTLLKLLSVQGYVFFFMPKWDGTCMQIFADADGKIHAYTLGSVNVNIKMQEALPHSPTFSQQALDLLTPEQIRILQVQPYHSVIMEMCTPYNVIVTKYAKPTLYPLMDIALDGLPRQQLFPYKRLGWCTSQTFDADLKECFAELLAHPELYGTDPEGVCLYAMKENEPWPVVLPLAKIKRPEYLELHHGVVLNVGSTKDLCAMQALVIANAADDVVEPIRKAHIVRFTAYLNDLAAKVDTEVLTLVKLTATPKAFAQHITASALPQWVKRALFRSRIHKTLPILGTTYAYLLTTLGEEATGHTVLSSCQQDGPLWFEGKPIEETPTLPLPEEAPIEKVSIITGLCVVDLDGTLLQIKEGMNFEATRSSFETKETLMDVNPYPAILRMVQAYTQAGFHIVVLTGRTDTLRSTIITILTNMGVIPDVIYCNPGGVATVVWKRKVVDLLISQHPGLKLFVHLDDHERVLRDGAALAAGRVRYVPLLAEKGRVGPLSADLKPVLVTLVQPSGSGKTTLLQAISKRIVDMGRTVVTLSFDALKAAYPEESSTARYERHTRSLNEAIHQGHVVLLDMINDKADTLKLIAQRATCESATLSFMDFKEGKVSSAYIDRCLAHCENRVTSRTFNGSSLTAPTRAILQRQAEGCANQISNKSRGVVLHPSATIDVMIEQLWLAVEPKLTIRTATAPFYLGLPVPPKLLTPTVLPIVVVPHVTIIPPHRVNVDDCRMIGTTYEVGLCSPVIDTRVAIIPVVLKTLGPVPDHPHITIAHSADVTAVAGLELCRTLTNPTAIGITLLTALVPL